MICCEEKEKPSEQSHTDRNRIKPDQKWPPHFGAVLTQRPDSSDLADKLNDDARREECVDDGDQWQQCKENRQGTHKKQRGVRELLTFMDAAENGEEISVTRRRIRDA